MNKHLTTDELVDRLYGIGVGDHIDDCQECSERLLDLRARKEMTAEPAEASYEFLAAQRRDIYARMGERPQARMKWVPALAAAAVLLAVGAIAHLPEGNQLGVNRAVQVAKPQSIDPQLFADVYSMEQSTEPIAAKPIHELFEQDQQ
jgi:hypothetical protein